MKAKDAFATIVGHAQQTQDIVRMLEIGKVPHGLLFSGPSGIGKQTVARNVAALLLSSAGGGTIDEKTFALTLTGNHPDLLWLRRDPEKKDISVESVRELIGQLRLRPYSAPCKVAIIDNADEMNTAAANALLMTLEEPVPNTYLFLVSANSQRLPTTIVSRCQTIHFASLSEMETFTLLQQMTGDGTLAKSVLPYTDGSLSLLELEGLVQPRSLAFESKAAVVEFLSSKHEQFAKIRRQVTTIVKALESGGGAVELLSVASDISADKEDLPPFWRLLQREVNRHLRSAPANQVSLWANAVREIAAAEKLIHERNVNPSLQLSSLLVNLQSE